MIKNLLESLGPDTSENVKTGSQNSDNPVATLPASEIAQAIGEAAERAEVPFRPTEAMCRVKARLFSRFEPSLNATSVSMLSKNAIVRLTGSSTVLDWAAKYPGFMGWLVSEDYFDEKLEWLDFLTLNALEEILLSDDPKAAQAKLSAAKLVLELKGRIKVKGATSVESVDKSQKSVQNLSDDELVKIIDVTKKKLG